LFSSPGRWKTDREYAGYLFNTAARPSCTPHGAVPHRLLFLFSIPRDLRMLFMGDNPLASVLMMLAS